MINESQVWFDYRNWLTTRACEWCSDHGSYSKLIDFLFDSKFIPSMEMDNNRAEDGREVRMRFSEEFPEYDYKGVYLYLYNAPCSMLEMMAALSMRIENEILWNGIDDRTGEWFYSMLRSTHLADLDDYSFDMDRAISIIDVLYRRDYAPNGDGGLFTVHRCNDDMRYLEIWYQAMRYINEMN